MFLGLMGLISDFDRHFTLVKTTTKTKPNDVAHSFEVSLFMDGDSFILFLPTVTAVAVSAKR